MPVRESSRNIDEAAARWAARLDRGPLSPSEQVALERWSSADPRRQGALARAQAVLAYCDEALATSDAAPVRGAARRGLRRREVLVGAGLAAGLAVVAGFWSLHTGQGIATRKGEVRSVELGDGSVAWLNTDTRLRVAYDRDRRSVRLAHGEAAFEVAPDRTRPFAVRAREVEVRAVGTSFAVSDVEGEPVRVLVQEGLVDLADQRGRAPAIRLAAGDLATADRYGRIHVIHPGPAGVARALSWRRGMLEFEGTTLAEAAATFARYSDERILIDDPAVARLKVTGLFAARDPAGFARAAATSLDLRMHKDAEGVHLTR